MKKIIMFFLFLSLLVTVPCYCAVTRNLQDNHQVVYEILDAEGTPVSGETVTLKIKKVSNGYWYDFDDNTFKTSGWDTKAINMLEDATEGYYYYTFTPPVSETSVEEYLFVVDNANPTYKDHQSELVSYQDIASSGKVWDELYGSHSVSGSFSDAVKRIDKNTKMIH